MYRHTIISAAGLALTLAAAPAHAAVNAQARTGSHPPATASQAASPADRHAMNRTDALAALQDARVTLARLTEESKPHDAGQALDQVSNEFRALYKAYTGEEPQPEKTATQASASRKQPDPNWQKHYDALSASIDRVLGRAADGHPGAVGTSGSTATALELSTPVRQNFEVLRQQLQRFHTAANGPVGRTGVK